MGEVIPLYAADALAARRAAARAYTGLQARAVAVQPAAHQVRPHPYAPQPYAPQSYAYAPPPDGPAIRALGLMLAMCRLRIVTAAALCGVVFGGIVFVIAGGAA